MPILQPDRSWLSGELCLAFLGPLEGLLAAQVALLREAQVVQELLAHSAGRLVALALGLLDAVLVGLLVLVVIGVILGLGHCWWLLVCGMEQRRFAG